MSQPNTPLPPAAVPPMAPVAAPRGPRERRVRTAHLLLAVALIVVGALGTASLITTVSARGTFLALAQDVDYGVEITAAHLTDVRIQAAPGLNLISTRERNKVIGLYAAMPLPAGTTLTLAHLSNESVAPGQRIVGLNLRRDRLPAQPPRAGDQITLVASPDRSSTGEEPARPLTFSATVTRVTGLDDAGGWFAGGSGSTVTIDVAVALAEAPQIAVLAVDGRISILLGGG